MRENETEENGPDKLTHDPVKGYPAAFYIIMAAAFVYLAFIFINSF